MNGTRAVLIAVTAAGLADCKSSGPPAPAPHPPETAAEPARDSLVLRTPEGYEVWLTDIRHARDSSGTACEERSVEIRTDSVRLRVPLLYTRRAPTPLDPRHIRAELSRDCRTVAVYRVELGTARPTRMEP